MYLGDEEKEVGKANFCAAVGSTAIRRDFLKQQINDSLASKKGLGSYYYGYGKVTDPVRVAVIGTGDEGSVLIGALNPEYMTVVSIADIRPYNVWRAFNGDTYSETAMKVRPGLLKVYGWKDEDEGKKNVKVYGAYQELIKNAKEDGVEAIIIALPLHLHAPCAVMAMKAGLHVLTEKLMAHSVRECKEMVRVAKEKDLYLAVGHQRHYNILYDHSVELIKKGVLGQLHYIRAQWHRNNLPENDSWKMPMPRDLKPGDPMADRLEKNKASWEKKRGELETKLAEATKKQDEKAIKELGRELASWEKKLAQLAAQLSDGAVKASEFGYTDLQIKGKDGTVLYDRPAAEELLRWRLWDRTGGGLMAELGSHQLDASCIFIAAAHAALSGDAGKNGLKPVHPLNVAAAGNRPIFPADRDCEDHVYCVFEFPSADYDAKDENGRKKKIGVQYASINGNGFGGYGETVMGTEGTLVLETEKDAMLFRGSDTAGKAMVRKRGDGGIMALVEAVKPVDVAQAERTEAMALGILGTLPADRGYAEQAEHFAFCIRNPDPANKPRCDGAKAMGDAVIALVTNMAARRGERIDFNEEWFNPESDETPEGEKPDASRYTD
jgi:predicted dehydrogenase